MVESTFKFCKKSEAGFSSIGRFRKWNYYYSTYFVGDGSTSYLGVVFKNKDFKYKAFYVLDWDREYVRFNTRLEAAIHLLFQNL